MPGPPIDSDETFLTPRQWEVLELRRRGLTQPDIADRIDTSVANVSSIEGRARENIERACRTIDLANDLRVDHWVEVAEGTHLREVVETVYEAGDEVGVKVPYSDPELSTYLHVRFRNVLDGRRLTDRLWIGLTQNGDVVTYQKQHPEILNG